MKTIIVQIDIPRFKWLEKEAKRLGTKPELLASIYIDQGIEARAVGPRSMKKCVFKEE